MAVDETGPHGLKKYTAGSDPFPGRLGYNEFVDAINQIPGCGIGSLSERPAPSAGLRFWVEESTGRMTVNTGTAWVEVAPVGGVYPSYNIIGATTGNEGSSLRAARADHQHPMPLASQLGPGAMSLEDKQKLDAATSTITANTMVMRDGVGQINVQATPNSNSSATSKSYVDSKVAAERTAAANASNLTTGTVPVDRLKIYTGIADFTGAEYTTVTNAGPYPYLAEVRVNYADHPGTGPSNIVIATPISDRPGQYIVGVNRRPIEEGYFIIHLSSTNTNNTLRVQWVSIAQR